MAIHGYLPGLRKNVTLTEREEDGTECREMNLELLLLGEKEIKKKDLFLCIEGGYIEPVEAG